jgi:hypothetical protein
MPTIVEPLDSDDDDDEGLVALPPQAARSKSAAQDTAVRVRVAIRMISSRLTCAYVRSKA